MTHFVEQFFSEREHRLRDLRIQERVFQLEKLELDVVDDLEAVVRVPEMVGGHQTLDGSRYVDEDAEKQVADAHCLFPHSSWHMSTLLSFINLVWSFKSIIFISKLLVKATVTWYWKYSLSFYHRMIVWTCFAGSALFEFVILHKPNVQRRSQLLTRYTPTQW